MPSDRQRPTAQGAPLTLVDHQAWPDSVDGAVLLDELAAVLRSYMIMPEHAIVAAVLWVVMTYCLDHVPVAVRLVVTSPTRECAKTRLLTLLWALARRALQASSITAAALFRSISAFKPTLLLDEVDNARLTENDELRAILNSGHSRGSAFVLRTVGNHHVPKHFTTWCAIALAGIGNLPDTLTSRAVVIQLQRKPRHVQVARLRENILFVELEGVRRRLARWAADHGPGIASAVPTLPEGIDGREADNWAVLAAIADAAGGRWPDRARQAAVAICGVQPDEPQCIQVLADLRALFAERSTDQLTSDDVVTALNAMEERGWAEVRHGSGLSKNGLARLLRPFGIQSRNLRVGERVAKGYTVGDCLEAFAGYLAIPTATALPTAPAADEGLFSGSTTGSGVANGNKAVSINAGAPRSDVADGTPESGESNEPACPCGGPVLRWDFGRVCTKCRRRLDGSTGGWEPVSEVRS